MSDRATLHASRLAEFVAWGMKYHGFKSLMSSGAPYEVARIADGKSRTHVFYQRAKAQHVTVTGDYMFQLVRKFIYQTRKA